MKDSFKHLGWVGEIADPDFVPRSGSAVATAAAATALQRFTPTVARNEDPMRVPD